MFKEIENEYNFSEKDIRYLNMLSKNFPTIESASTEIINLRAILNLPKGTEHFLTDIHGEYESFNHVINNASGVIKEKIDLLFGKKLSKKSKKELATIIYYPEEKLQKISNKDHNWYKITLYRLVQLCRLVSSKYTRSKVRKALPKDYGYIIEELFYEHENDYHKQQYYDEILDSIINIGKANDFIVKLSYLIQRLAVDQLHILGDIFDRGPEAELVMEKLVNHHNADIQWGNHDIIWMGAGSGCVLCSSLVLRISLRYANLETLKDGYGIDILPLATFALKEYGEDNCKQFIPKANHGKYDKTEIELISKMHKAISIIQFKLEGQCIMRNPEFDMNDRLLLDKINFEKNTILIDGENVYLADYNFPTVDKNNPYKLTKEENKLIQRIAKSFKNSEKLKRHIKFLYDNGSIYKKYNYNLMFHGAIPMNKNGSFKEYIVGAEKYNVKEFMEFAEKRVREGYYSLDIKKRAYGQDMMWYLWCGPDSPLFGKNAMTTFERYFINDKRFHKERKNPYYKFRENEEICKKILKMFDCKIDEGHIINGHVPVKVKKGETPVKANGKLIDIDGGFAKAYQKVTGIAGYTLIINSRALLLAEHKPFESKYKAIVDEYDALPKTKSLTNLNKRLLIKHTDIGNELKYQIEDLLKLINAYKKGVVKQKK